MEEQGHNNLDQPVTQRQFKDDLKEFADKAFTTFATKDDLEEFAKKKDIERFKDEILTSNDKVVKKMDDMMAEFGAKIVGDERRDDKLEELDGRVSSVEIKVGLRSAAS